MSQNLAIFFKLLVVILWPVIVEELVSVEDLVSAVSKEYQIEKTTETSMHSYRVFQVFYSLRKTSFFLSTQRYY